MADISVVVTVKNEEDSILTLLESLENQSLKPSEIIIVDGGSSDRTVEIINSFIRTKNSFKLILAEGANIAKGRNIGISHAKSEIIACTDAGVVLDKFWLENITKPIVNDDADFVGGVYVQSGKSLLQECIGILQYPNLEKLTPDNFFPSSRSVAFKKSVWKSVGGYPEHLDKAEDTYFDLKVKEGKFNITLAKNAIAFMPSRDSLKKLFAQYSSYAEWDVKAGLYLKLKIYRLMIAAYAFLVFSLLLIWKIGILGFLFSLSIVLVYLFLAGLKVLIKTRRGSAFFLGAAIKITIFMAESFGLLKGLASRLFSRR